jgi:molecular chaperone GrpE (heat shock protein)
MEEQLRELEELMLSAKKEHSRKLQEMARKEDAAQERLIELESVLAELTDDQKRLDLWTVEKQLTEKRASLETLSSQWENLRASSAQAEQAAAKLTAQLTERAAVLEGKVKTLEADLSRKSAELKDLTSTPSISPDAAPRVPLEAAALDGTRRGIGEVTTFRKPEPTRNITPLLEKLALVDRAHAAIADSFDEVKVRAHLQILRNTIALELQDQGVNEFELACGAALDHTLADLAEVHEHIPSEGPCHVLQTLAAGFLLSRPNEPNVVLRPAIVLSGGTR